jgi:hypothetical protein
MEYTGSSTPPYVFHGTPHTIKYNVLVHSDRYDARGILCKDTVFATQYPEQAAIHAYAIPEVKQHAAPEESPLEYNGPSLFSTPTQMRCSKKPIFFAIFKNRSGYMARIDTLKPLLYAIPSKEFHKNPNSDEWMSDGPVPLIRAIKFALPKSLDFLMQSKVQVLFIADDKSINDYQDEKVRFFNSLTAGEIDKLEKNHITRIRMIKYLLDAGVLTHENTARNINPIVWNTSEIAYNTAVPDYRQFAEVAHRGKR